MLSSYYLHHNLEADIEYSIMVLCVKTILFKVRALIQDVLSSSFSFHSQILKALDFRDESMKSNYYYSHNYLFTKLPRCLLLWAVLIGVSIKKKLETGELLGGSVS